jgi:hypothetical protein
MIIMIIDPGLDAVLNLTVNTGKLFAYWKRVFNERIEKEFLMASERQKLSKTLK